MTTSTVPSVVPAEKTRPAEVFPEKKSAGKRSVGFIGRLAWMLGWIWRLGIGALCCANYFSSILVVGWTYRRMQGTVLRGWWKQEKAGDGERFEDLLESLGPDAPVLRPRWLLREHLGQVWHPEAERRSLWHIVQIPWHSLWLNYKIGLQGLFCTFLATGLGCLLMTFSWEFGWVNSFNKGYEQALIGPLSGVVGSLLFILAMFYVPMAQVHQAVTGQARAFFDFRFIIKLIHARFTAYLFLAACTLLIALPLEILKAVPMFLPQINPGFETAESSELLEFFQTYMMVCGLVWFVSLVLLRGLAARIYGSAVLKVLREDAVSQENLHPFLKIWLDRLGCLPQLGQARSSLATAIRTTNRWAYRSALYGLLFVVWTAFVVKVYVGEFINYHPYVGFLNHPVVQLPCCDYIPNALEHD